MEDLHEKENQIDRIEKYYLNQRVLSDKDKKMCERLELAFSIYSEQRNKQLAIKKYMAVLESKNMKISQAVAYSDFNTAELIFTPLHKYSKEFLKLVIIESAMKDIKKAEQWMEKSTNHKEMAQCMAWKDKAELRIIEASGLKVTDPNLPDFKKLYVSRISVNIDPVVEIAFRNALKKGVVDITDFYKNAEDVSYEEGE